ncbi:MAG: DUF262 domain-containing protein [Cytophagales bacterium]|nr:DUF262 domain-containing protein [Cytophagales bacterium]
MENTSENIEKTGIEIEVEDLGQEIITKPYDPEKIKIDHQNVDLGFLLEKLEYNEIDLMPDFQREGDLWDNIKKSQLIESILLGLPLPSFYFSVDAKTDKWQVVDGLQRLSTFQAFWVKKTLKLEGLEFLDSYDGKSYSDLTRADLRKISGFKVNLYVIEKETPKEAKFLIFKRVNTGGLILTPQEMRHALNQGIPADFIKGLSQLESFKKATDYRIPSKRQEDRDFVNRFIAFYLLGYEEGYKGELDAFLNDGMAKLEQISIEERNNVKSNFKDAMEISYKIFGNDAFRKRYDLNERRKPISKAVFDSISVNIAWLSKQDKAELLNKKDLIKHELINLFNSDERFHRSITTATGQKANVVYRFEKIKTLFNEVLRS